MREIQLRQMTLSFALSLLLVDKLTGLNPRRDYTVGRKAFHLSMKTWQSLVIFVYSHCIAVEYVSFSGNFLLKHQSIETNGDGYCYCYNGYDRGWKEQLHQEYNWKSKYCGWAWSNIR